MQSSLHIFYHQNIWVQKRRSNRSCNLSHMYTLTFPVLQVTNAAWLPTYLRRHFYLADPLIKDRYVHTEAIMCAALTCIHPEAQQQFGHSKKGTVHVLWRYSLDEIKGFQAAKPGWPLDSSYLHDVYCINTMYTVLHNLAAKY